jgi:PqqD family protein of HPr-rel-A system
MSDVIKENTPPRWRVPVKTLTWLCRDGEYIVYCEGSGRTHYIDASGGLIFSAAVDQAVSETELCRLLSERLGVNSSDIDSGAIASIISRMEDSGLLEGVG